jgi:hypothetical protein
LVELNRGWRIFNLVLDPEGDVLGLGVTFRGLKGAEKPGRRRAWCQISRRSSGGRLGNSLNSCAILEMWIRVCSFGFVDYLCRFLEVSAGG